MRLLHDATAVTLGHAIAARFATRHRADTGARVTKVERVAGMFCDKEI